MQDGTAHSFGEISEVETEKLQRICVEETTSISESIRKLDEGGEKIILITQNQKLTGVVTDGDIRRWILNKGSFDKAVSQLMHRNPHVLLRANMEEARQKMLDFHIEAIPIVDDENIPIDVIFLREVIAKDQKQYEQISVPVVIMAGGKGSRLYPYTSVLPKPLIPIGTTTILERIIESFRENGCNEFALVLNYKKNLIKAYLDEKEKAYQVQYVEEGDYKGTCGGIKLLQNQLTETFFVSNCDVLLDLDFAKVLHYHQQNRNEITVVTFLKRLQIPYGVIELGNGGIIKGLLEKPSQIYNVNTGIYLMEPSVIKDIPAGQMYDMPDLINKLLKENRCVGAYPVTENRWHDMGEMTQLQRMLENFHDA